MSKTVNRYITVLDYAEKSLLVLSGTSFGVFLALFANIVGAPFWTGIASV